MNENLENLAHRLRDFAKAREWEQFHTPKNLAMALVGEAGELAAEMQWLSDDGVSDGLAEGTLRDRLSDEMADVLIYLTRLADVTGVDLMAATHAKIKVNETRFPVGLVRGRPSLPSGL